MHLTLRPLGGSTVQDKTESTSCTNPTNRRQPHSLTVIGVVGQVLS